MTRVEDRIEVVDGFAMYRISDVDSMDPFLMTVVSSSDLWMFVSSAGGLTAGRVEPSRCLFPYETDDRLHVAHGRVGPATVLRVRTENGPVPWEPFGRDAVNSHRSLSKSLLGHTVVFEDERVDLGLTFRYRWAPSDRFGWVRTASVHNNGAATAEVELVDGLVGVMPWGIDLSLQQRMSNLANAYKLSEVLESGLAVYALESRVTDRPEPEEALRATTVWSAGLTGAAVTVDPGALDRVRSGRPFESSDRRTGRPGAYLLHLDMTLEAGQGREWHVVAEVAQAHTDIARVDQLLRSDADLVALVEDDIGRGASELEAIVASADGLQCTASTKSDAHHLANTLFNVMRGGTALDAGSVRAERFRDFVAKRNRDVSHRHADWMAGLPDSIHVRDLLTRAREPRDPNLVRLAHEYLPLTFSRRHGDPSRPWNRFSIRVKDDVGEPVLGYEGNWRDIFQNWEALGRSYPGYLASVVAKFANASTLDGHNPYRITGDGIDWEVLDPDDPWSGIGYWGDHQIVYLHRLLESMQAHDPGRLAAELGQADYSFADVPYRIVPYEQILRDPKSTIEFDHDVESATAERVADVGADGKLVVDSGGAVVHVTLLEKLLIPMLAKLSNYVPRGGIWMNTQRPEWNDANNALVGNGLSMVTLAQLGSYLRFLADLTTDLTEAHPVSSEVIAWADAVTGVLESRADLVGAESIDPADRASMVRELGEAYDRYRAAVYDDGPSSPAPLDPERLRALLRVGLVHLDDAFGAARRSDGLYHSYNTLRWSADATTAEVEHLPLMLEGQVAAVSSGLIEPAEVVDLVESMYESELYRADLDSFMLYPPPQRPPFADRNVVPPGAVEGNRLLLELLARGTDAVVVRDADGRYRFDAEIGNAADLDVALDELERSPLGPLVQEHRAATHEAFEAVFGHREFTGRSSRMHAYEGIGSVYWHMVAKLLVAIQEAILRSDPGADPAAHEGLLRLYDRVRAGLGFNRSAAEFGAFPTDPYSHTPAHAGAQQPGMTGQVKEELLTRWAELGVTVVEGSLRFTPTMLSRSEFRTAEGALGYVDVTGARAQLVVDPGAMAFTLCQVPIVVHPVDAHARIVVTTSGGERHDHDGWHLDPTSSRHVFDRTGHVERLDVFVPEGLLRSTR